jgi:O-antigen/teichoic acid export membrane protein
LITIIFGRASQFLLALVMMRVATTLLSPAEMGRVSLVLTTTAFFALFLVNPVGMFINRRLHSWQATGVAVYYLIRYVIYLLLVALVAAIGLPLFYMSGIVNFGVPMGWLLILVCSSLLFNTINQTSIPSLNMLGDSKSFVLLSVATLALGFACASLLVKVQPVAQYWLLGLLLGQAVFALFGTRVLFEKLHTPEKAHVLPAISKRHLKGLFNFSWPVSIAAGLAWVQGQGYRYLMDGQLGLSQLGLFVTGYGVSAGMIAAFESVLTTYFQPRLYRDVSMASPELQAQAWHRYAAAVIPSLILTVALIIILSPELTRILLGKNFQSAASFLMWGALAEAARVLAGVYSLIAHVHMRTRWLIMPNVIGATLSIMLVALLIPIMGAAGAGIGLMVSGFAVVLVMHIFLVKWVGSDMPMRSILIAGGASAALWITTLCFRSLFDSTGWIAVLGVCAVIGTSYLGLQYLFLREHLKDKRIV